VNDAGSVELNENTAASPAGYSAETRVSGGVRSSGVGDEVALGRDGVAEGASGVVLGVACVPLRADGVAGAAEAAPAARSVTRGAADRSAGDEPGFLAVSPSGVRPEGLGDA